MRVLHGVADLSEEDQALFHGEPTLVAIPVDRIALDVFHHQEWEARVHHPRVQQMGDVGVFEPGQHALLETEATQLLSRCQAAMAHQLDGHDLLQVIARRFEDDAHATLPDLASESVRAYALTHCIRLDVVHPAQRRKERFSTDTVECVQQRVNLVAQWLVVATGVVQKGSSRRGGKLRHHVENLEHPAVHIGLLRHRAVDDQTPACNARPSHAFAKLHRRRTVATDMSSAIAVSESVRPPK